MAAIQLAFTLRTSANCKTVHLVGSWDSYKGRLPLSKTEKAGGWKGNFKFQGATLKPGQRYWYYYMIDGHVASHDPSRDHVVEPTTGRKLNTLDIPGKPSSTKTSSRETTSRSDKRKSIPKGRGVSPSRIVSPKPVHPSQAARALARGDFSKDPRVVELARRLAAARLAASSDDESEDDDSSDIDSDAESDVPSLTSRSSRSSGSSSPSSVSSDSSCCTCERYGITRGGSRVKLDCGGARCGSSDGSECSSESEDEYRARTTRRQGVVVRA